MKPFSQSSTISIFFLLLRIDTHVKVSFKTMGLKQWREERGEMVKGWGKLHRRTNRKLCRASLFGEKKIARKRIYVEVFEFEAFE